MLAGFVDSQAWLLLYVSVAPDSIRPLIAVVTIRIGELDIIQPELARVAFPVLAHLEALLGFTDDWVWIGRCAIWPKCFAHLLHPILAEAS
jgi:hypothetical protein